MNISTEKLAVTGNRAVTDANEYFKQLEMLHSEIRNDLKNFENNRTDVSSEKLLHHLLGKEFVALDKLNDLQFRFLHSLQMK